MKSSRQRPAQPSRTGQKRGPSPKVRSDSTRPGPIRITTGDGVFIGGRNAVRQIIMHAPERILDIFISNSTERMDRTGGILIETIQHQLIPYQQISPEALQKMFRHHQGFVAKVKPRIPLDLQGLEDFAAGMNNGVILALDGVQDPQNVGSILRAADSFGVECVVWSKNRSAPITDAVSSASAGALQFVQTAIVSNLREALVRLKKIGFFSVATMISDAAVDLYSFTFPSQTVLIMGSESDGIQPLIAKEADFQVYLRQHGVVDSLNVGQATAVFLNEFQRQAVLEKSNL